MCEGWAVGRVEREGANVDLGQGDQKQKLVDFGRGESESKIGS